MTVRTRTNVPLTEEFQATGYDDYQTALDVSGPLGIGRQPGTASYNYSLSTQNHVDVRTFNNPSATGSIPENWSVAPSVAFTLGPSATYNNWLAMSATLASGFTTFISTAMSLDLTVLGEGALLTLELPAFPTGSLTLASCFVDLINGSDIASASFASGYAANRLSLPLVAFEGIDLTSVDTIRFRFQATGACTINMLALRLVDPLWIASSMDFDNWNGFYRQTVPPAANTSYFPLVNAQQLPAIWRAADTGVTDDPQPINSSIAVTFNTGSANNQDFISLNVRQVGGTDTSQLILDNLTQAQLNGPQPSLITTDELPREVGDIEGASMGSLVGETMLDLTALETQTTETWIQFALQWGPSPSVGVLNTSNPAAGYQWGGVLFPALANNTYYMAVFTLVDTQARIQIYELDQTNLSTRVTQAITTAPLATDAPLTSIPASVITNIPAGAIEVASGIHAQLFTTSGAIAGATHIPVTSEAPQYAFPIGSTISTPAAVQTLLFDTGLISDSYQFIRRPGRFGWSASFLDGDASIRSIRPQSLVFAEYQSAILASATPVKGARLYAEFTPNTQMWRSFSLLNPATILGSETINELYPSPGLYPSPSLYPGEPGIITPVIGDVAPTVSVDFNRQLTGSSYKVFVSDASVSNQGVVSNILTPISDPLSGIIDFANVAIELSVWFPSAAQNAGSTLAMFLASEDGSVVPLSVPALQPDHWQSLTLYPPGDLQSGRYQLGIVYVGDVSTTFWVDAVSVFERVVTWSARANQEDPWTDFRDIINSDSSGVTFADRGTELQLRAQAHQQAGAIFSYPNLVPVYAELGRFSFPESVVPDPFPTSNVGTFTQSGTTVHPATLTFQAVTSYGALTAPLSASSSGVSSLTAHVTTTIPSNASLTLSAPGVGSQTWFTAPGATSGASSITVNTEAPSLNFPIGSVVGLFAPAWDIISYQWSFGDGGAAVGATTQHTFTEAGSFTVTLTMIDIYGGRSVVNGTLAIT